jgi:hypothetical protein
MTVARRHPWLGHLGIRLFAVAIVLLAMLVVTAGADAKKKKGGAKVFSQQKTVNAPIPNPANNNTPGTPLVSTITIPKKFKGKQVGDVNVTGLQTTGSGPGASGELAGYLTSPSGRVLELFFHIGPNANASLGPWTIDDDTPVSICAPGGGNPCVDPDQSLYPPYAGTSNTDYNWGGGFPVNGTLSIFNGTPMRGDWRLTVVDDSNGGATSVLNQWGLRIKPLKPVKA